MPTSPTPPKTDLPPPDAPLALAPLRLPNYRRVRYAADDLYVELDQLAARDQTLLRILYQRLTELLYLIADAATTDAQKWTGVQDWIDRHDLNEIIQEVRELGVASDLQNPEQTKEKMAKAMHDVRGGALSSLLGRLQLLGYFRTLPGALNVLFVQARDHLKIMRSAIVGLDEARRNADRTPKAHAMALMLDKWQESVVGPHWRERPIRLEIDCRYEGALTECCLESAAIDRIFYNLAANACRHAADERLEMVIFPIPEPPGDCLRFVLSNQINEADAAWLHSLARSGGADSIHLGTGESLFALFEPEVSSSGSGFGLTVVADFVAGAFGLHDRAEALRERYVGAILEGQTFRVWFHWPMAHDNLPLKLDDYHRPQESMSES